MVNHSYSKAKKRAVLACIATMFCLGGLYLWSLFQSPVAAYLGWDVARITLVPSFMLCGYTVGNFSGGVLGDRFGPRFTATLGGLLFLLGNLITSLSLPVLPELIYFSYSGLAGMGTGLGYNAATNCIQKWFPEARATGAGIAVAAFGLSTAVWAFPIEYLLTSPLLGEQTVTRTFLIMGIVFGGLQIGPVGYHVGK